MQRVFFLFCGMITFLIGQTTPAQKLHIQLKNPYLGTGWSPVLVEVDNQDTIPFEGEVWIEVEKIKSRSRYYDYQVPMEGFRHIHVPAQTKKRFWMYLFIERYRQEFYWKVREKGKKNFLLQGVVPIVYSPYSDFLIFTLSQDKNLFHHLHQQTSNYVRFSTYYSSSTYFKVTHAEPDVLPERREGYDPLNLVILNQFPLEGDMTVPQINALKEWVAEGGAVLLSPGSESWIQSSLVQDLFPVTLEKTEAQSPEDSNEQGFSLHQLEPFVGDAKKVDYLFYHFKYPKGTRFFIPTEEDSKEAQPSSHMGYLACYPYHKGWVYLTPFDVSRQPLKNWGRDFYDKYLFKDCSPGYQEENPYKQLHKYITPEKRVSLLNFFFLLIAYLILMGPIQYYLLYRWKIRSYLLLSVTIMSFLSVGLVFLYGEYSYGTQEPYEMYTFLTGTPTHQIETSLLNISSQKNQTYVISGEPKTSIQLLASSQSESVRQSVIYNQSDGRMEVQLPIGLWNNRSFFLRTHHISPTLRYPLEAKKTKETLEIRASEEIEGFYVYNQQYRLVYARETKFSPHEDPIQITLDSKVALNEPKEFHKMRSYLSDKIFPSKGEFILIRYSKPRHQIQVNGESLPIKNNRTFFIQPYSD